jgi:glycosyltransferase involved in cell wall biosynthesis
MESVFFLVTHTSRGGVQELWEDLAEGFRIRGVRSDLLALYPAETAHGEKLAGWRYVAPRRPTTLRQQMGTLRDLAHIFKQERPTLVITAMPAANVVAPLAARLAGNGVRVVTTHHSPTHTHNPLLNAVDSLTGSLKSVQTIVSVSHAVSASLERKPAKYRAKRRVIQNALPPRVEKHLTMLAGPIVQRQARGRTVVAVGRLAAQKNHPMLLRAAVHMPDVEVLIIGAGPDEAMLKEMAVTLGVEQRVQFLGQLSREDALARLAAGDVFVQVSLYEGHSLALLEAARLGLPLVVSDVQDQIEGTTAADGTRCALIVDRSDDVGLACVISRLLSVPSHYALWASRARHLAADATFEGMIAKYESLVTPSGDRKAPWSDFSEEGQQVRSERIDRRMYAGRASSR